MKFTEGIRKRLRNDFDAVIVLTGEPGDGKSTFMQILGFQIDDKFSQDKNISYIPTTKDIINKFNSLDQYQVFCIDEAIEVLFKNDHMSSMQKTLVKMYNRERKQNKCTIMCIPSFTDLAKSFRNTRVKYWIYVVERGHGLLMARPKTPFSDDAWMLKKFDKIFTHDMDRKRSTLSNEDIVNIMKKSPLFVEELNFRDLPESKKEIYQQHVKIERDKFYASEDGDKSQFTKRERAFMALAYNLHEEFNWSYKKIAMWANNHLSDRTVSSIIQTTQPQLEPTGIE